jgi:hypothetical protein
MGILHLYSLSTSFDDLTPSPDSRGAAGLNGRPGGGRFKIYRSRSANQMPRFHGRIVSFLIAVSSFGAVAADRPDDAKAVTPGGPGVLTKCRGWVVTASCRTYHHITLPSRIAVGDTITISFGSHPKEFAFSVARIDLEGQHCAIFSKANGDRHRMDKINIAPCYRAEEGR